MAINRASASVHVSETYGVKERNVSKYNSTLIISFCLVCTVIFCGMLVFPRSTYTTVCVWDLFLFLDGAYRIAAKQIPHVDFHTPLGALNYILPYWGQKLSGHFGSAMPVALALSLIALMLAMIHILVSRLHYYVALPVALYLQLLVAAPALIQADHTYITMAMWYNRFCWAALSLLLLMYMQPHISSNKIKWFDGLSVGLILLLLVYTKISYGVVGIAFVLLWGLLKRESFLSVTIGFMVFIMIGVLVEIIWHFHQGYIDDIALAMNASGALRGSWETFPKLVLQNLSEILLVSFAWIFVARSRLANGRDFIFVLFVVGSSSPF